MTVKECYDAISADYEGVYSRMMKKEALVKRFAKKFLDDGSYASLKESLAGNDVETAFRAAHTLKGVAQNLGFTTLYEPSSKLTNILRNGSMEGTDTLFAEVSGEYEKIVAVIRQMED